MNIVVLFFGIMITMPILQVLAILIYIQKGTYIQHSNIYSPETIEKVNIVTDAIKKNVIKKHTIINYAPEYDSKKTMIQYRNFLSSDLMKDIEKI